MNTTSSLHPADRLDTEYRLLTQVRNLATLDGPAARAEQQRLIDTPTELEALCEAAGVHLGTPTVRVQRLFALGQRFHSNRA